MLRKLLLSTAIVAASTTFTYAADAVPIDDPVPPTVSEIGYDWSGLYVGGTLGKGSGEADLDFPLNPATFGDLDGKGITYGIFAGYNLSLGNGFIVGLEGDYIRTGFTADGPVNSFGIPTNHWDVDIEWMASIRARAGFAVSDQLLVFATAGWATAKIDGRIFNDLAGTVFREGFSGKHHGWTAGGGLEYAFSNNWVARIEARYSDFGNENFDLPITVPFDLGFSVTEVRAGISYKF